MAFIFASITPCDGSTLWDGTCCDDGRQRKGPYQRFFVANINLRKYHLGVLTLSFHRFIDKHTNRMVTSLYASIAFDVGMPVKSVSWPFLLKMSMA